MGNRRGEEGILVLSGHGLVHRVAVTKRSWISLGDYRAHVLDRNRISSAHQRGQLRVFTDRHHWLSGLLRWESLRLLLGQRETFWDWDYVPAICHRKAGDGSSCLPVDVGICTLR